VAVGDSTVGLKVRVREGGKVGVNMGKGTGVAVGNGV